MCPPFTSYRSALRRLADGTQISMVPLIHEVQRTCRLYLEDASPRLARLARGDYPESMMAKHAMEIAKDPAYQNPVNAGDDKSIQKRREAVMTVCLFQSLLNYLLALPISGEEEIAITQCYQQFMAAHT